MGLYQQPCKQRTLSHVHAVERGGLDDAYCWRRQGSGIKQYGNALGYQLMPMKAQTAQHSDMARDGFGQ